MAADTLPERRGPLAATGAGAGSPRFAAGLGPWLVFGGLGAVVAANVVMITLAVQRPATRIAEDHYAASLHFDEVIAARRASAALGWQVVRSACTPAATGRCAVMIEVRDAGGAAIDGLTGELRIERANDVTLDRAAAVLPAGAPGRYVAELEPGRDGSYQAHLTLHGAAGTFLRSEPLKVSPTAPAMPQEAP